MPLFSLLSSQPPPAPAPQLSPWQFVNCPFCPPPPGGCSRLFSAPAPSVLSSLALSEQTHLPFPWAPSPAGPPPPAASRSPLRSPPAAARLAPPPRLPRRRDPSGPSPSLRAVGVVSARRPPGGPRRARSAGVRRDRGGRRAGVGLRGRESLSEPERPGEKGESECEARTPPGLGPTSAVASDALERRPSHCSFSP